MTDSSGDIFPKAVQSKNHFTAPEGFSHQGLLDSMELSIILHNTRQYVTQHKDYIRYMQNTQQCEKQQRHLEEIQYLQYEHMIIISLNNKTKLVESPLHSNLLNIVECTVTYYKSVLSVFGQRLYNIQAQHNTDTPGFQDDICNAHRAKANLFDKPVGTLQCSTIQFLSNRHVL